MNADFQSCSIDSLQTKPPPSTISPQADHLASGSNTLAPTTSRTFGEQPPPSDPSPIGPGRMNESKPTKVIPSYNNQQQQQQQQILQQAHNRQPEFRSKAVGGGATAKTSANQLNEPRSSLAADINRISDCVTTSATLGEELGTKSSLLVVAPTTKTTTTTTAAAAEAASLGGRPASNSLIKSCNPKLCSICHQEIIPQVANSWSEPAGEVPTRERRKQQLEELDGTSNRRPPFAADRAVVSSSSQLHQNHCQSCLINSIQEEELQLNNYSNHFWKFISNLPKSILQRRTSSSGNLNSEVLGYLERFSTSSGGFKSPQVVLVESASASEMSNREKSFPGGAGIGADKSPAAQSIKDEQLTVINIRPQAPPPNRSATTSNISSTSNTALVENVQLQERCSVGGTSGGSGLKLIQVSSPAGGLFSAKQQSSINQQANKLSIAASLTTRSSVSSISSCILSSSSTSEVRLKWGKKMDFLLSIIGFAVDLANIWRFPYLVYKNGGGVFFIPYIIMMIFGGIPLFFLELCLGQFVKKGPITVWNKICPSMKGVGYCSILVSWYVSFYYNVLIAWSVYFIYRSILSFGDKMPWEDCDNSWNSKGTCVSISQLKELCAVKNETLEHCRKELFSTVNVTSPASEFFVKELSQLDQSTGVDDLGYLRPELVLCLMVVYLLHYLSLFRGLETSGKVVWVTATAPYIILSILLIRGLFLPGASMGIAYYLSPNLDRLKDPQVWIDAAGQVFYSIGVGFGVHLTYASFNSHNNNCHRDCLMTSAVNAITSAYSGLVVFVYLGYMAQNLGIEIDKVASEGYSLIFEVYPEALTTLPFARFWSILFFIMLLTLGIDSAMGGLESVITGLEDEFKFAKRLSRGQLTGLVIISSFLPALISCTQGGAYTIFWFDIYSAGVSLLFSALFETIGVVYCYGLKKFIPNVESMLGRRPHVFYLVCWKYISPLFLGGVIVMSIITAQVPVYRNYTFPLWSIVLGWCLAFSSVAMVPLFAAWYWLTDQKGKRISSSPDRRKKDRLSVGSSKKTPTNYTPVSVTCPNHAQTSVAGGASGGAGAGAGTSGTLLTTATITTILNDHQDML